MAEAINIFVEFISRNATTLNIILGLFIMFQWFRQYSKEQSIKNTLFAMRRILNSVPESTAAVETLDAALATLGARNPFVKRFCVVRDMIMERFQKEEIASVEELQNEKETGKKRRTKP